MTESNVINLQTVPKNPDQNWLICYLIQATYQLDRTIGFYKHWRDIAKADPECALDEALAPAVDEQMKLADKTVGVLMDQVYNGLTEALGVETDLEAFRKQQDGAS